MVCPALQVTLSSTALLVLLVVIRNHSLTLVQILVPSVQLDKSSFLQNILVNHPLQMLQTLLVIQMSKLLTQPVWPLKKQMFHAQQRPLTSMVNNVLPVIHLYHCLRPILKFVVHVKQDLCIIQLPINVQLFLTQPTQLISPMWLLQIPQWYYNHTQTM